MSRQESDKALYTVHGMTDTDEGLNYLSFLSELKVAIQDNSY